MLERIFISYRNIDDESINIDEINLEDKKKYSVLLIQASDFNPKGADEEDIIADYTSTLEKIVSSYTKIQDIKKILAMLPGSSLDDDKISAPLISSAKKEIKNIYYRQADLHILESTNELQNMKKRYEKRISSAQSQPTMPTSTYIRQATPQPRASEPISKQSLWESTSRSSPRKKETFFEKILPYRGLIILLTVFVVVLIIVTVSAYNLNDSQGSSTDTTANISNSKPSNSKPQLTPVTEPRTGAILSGSEYYNGSELTIHASSGHSYVVKLKDASGVTLLSFYVRAGDTVTVNVPSAYLYVYFASGDIWYGTEHLFGDDTSYSMDDDIQNFIDYTWEYTLYPVTHGNFSETPISADQFK